MTLLATLPDDWHPGVDADRAILELKVVADQTVGQPGSGSGP